MAAGRLTGMGVIGKGILLTAVWVVSAVGQKVEGPTLPNSRKPVSPELKGLRSLGLRVTLPTGGRPLDVTEAEIKEAVISRLSAAGIRVAKDANPSTAGALLAITFNKQSVCKEDRPTTSSLVTAPCVSFCGVGISLKRFRPATRGEPTGLKEIWSGGLGFGGTGEICNPGLSELEKVLDQFLTDYATANPRGR